MLVRRSLRSCTYLILILLVVCLFPLMKVKLPTILIYTILSRVLDGPGTIVGPSLRNTLQCQP